MGKGSGRRPQGVTDEQMEEAWNSIFAGHPNEDQFEDCIKKPPPVVKEDGYGNVLPKPNDPDRFVDDTGDA